MISVCTFTWLRQHDICMYIGLAKIAYLYVHRPGYDSMISICILDWLR